MVIYLVFVELSITSYATDVRLLGVFDTEEGAEKCVEATDAALKEITRFTDGDEWDFSIVNAEMNSSAELHGKFPAESGLDIVGGIWGAAYYE